MVRMRVFAGPNGSGKTTLNEYLQGQVNFGVYLNPDDFYNVITQNRTLDLTEYGITSEKVDWHHFQNSHTLYKTLPANDAQVKEERNTLIFSKPPSVYLVSIVISYVRQLLFEDEKTFSFETVFSHPSKVQLMQEAAQRSYRTYLYFVCTNSPDINVLRVQQRTREGGHDVPEEKIRARYDRSLTNLTQAISIAYRTYLFDNSGREASLIADVTPGKRLNLRRHTAPPWFHEHVLPLFS